MKLHHLAPMLLLGTPLFATAQPPAAPAQPAPEPTMTPEPTARPRIFPTPQRAELLPLYTKVKTAEYIQLDPARPLLGVPKLPHKEGAYAIVIKPERLTVYSYDEAGRFYAKQTISQLLRGVEGNLLAQKDPFPKKYFEAIARMGELPMGTIIDWPDMPYRGVVEGYYGTPWTIEDRKSQIEFYGRNKMNTYIWAPKDDPYHHGFRSREPYPEDVAQQIRELCQLAEKNHVKFIWAIHPANTVDWSKDNGKPDMDLLVKKLELMYDLGVRHYGVFVDDSNGEINQAKRQAQLCTYLTENFINKKSDVGPVIMCPTGYSRGWTPAPWLKELGENLHPDVRVMWTGDGVAWKILLEGQQWVRKALGRPTFIWWNWPCTDYTRSQLALGRTYDLSQDPSMRELINGFVSNPMEWPEASKLGVFGVGDYAWNITQFDSHANWYDGVKRLFPSNPEAMQLLAEHNSDLGNNGHGFTREESETLTPTITALTEALDSGKHLDPQLLQRLDREYQDITAAAATLLSDEQLAKLRQEIAPWIELLSSTGQLGHNTIAALSASDRAALGSALEKLIRAQQRCVALRNGQKKPSVGYKRLTPITYRLVSELNSQLRAQFTGSSAQWSQPRFSSSTPMQDPTTEDKTRTIPMNASTAHLIHDNDEQSCWTQNKPQKVGEWYMLDYGVPREIHDITLVMGGNRPEDYIARGQMEYSNDGTTWHPATEPTEGGRIHIKPKGEDGSDKPLSARYLRYRTLIPNGGRWVNIATFGINRDAPVPLSDYTDIPLWADNRISVSKGKGSYQLERINEIASMPPAARFNMSFPAIERADELVFDLDTQLSPWAVLKFHGEPCEQNPTGELLVDLSLLEPSKDAGKPYGVTLDGKHIPPHLTGISVYNASMEPVGIRLKEFILTYTERENDEPRAMQDGDILSAWDSSQSESPETQGSISPETMTHIPLPEGTARVVILASREPDYLFGSQPEIGRAIGMTPLPRSAPHVYEYSIPAGSSSLSFVPSSPEDPCLIYEIYFVPAQQAKD